jgi:hypothetical protein
LSRFLGAVILARQLPGRILVQVGDQLPTLCGNEAEPLPVDLPPLKTTASRLDTSATRLMIGTLALSGGLARRSPAVDLNTPLSPGGIN